MLTLLREESKWRESKTTLQIAFYALRTSKGEQCTVHAYSFPLDWKVTQFLPFYQFQVEVPILYTPF